ncbi:hypothetical protein CDL15_Pgr008840 [Punica granatum]|uniref:Calmodulin-binding domain-containing protein n=1 Tax=Punica granatum TaxID=22663 RepID=A0A218VYV1_PUNGR|nr:hypothetical protein CDL15_Pgr008840 [Punica granatum]
MVVDSTDEQLIDKEINSKFGHSGSTSMGRTHKLKNRKIQSVPSRYLATKVGSCHDFCKHGKKHPPDENVGCLTSKRISCVPHGCTDLEKAIDMEARDKKSTLDVSENPINGRKSCLPREKIVSFHDHSAEMEVSLDSARDHKANPVDDGMTNFFQHLKETELSSDLASDHDEAKAALVNSLSIPAPGSPSDGRDSETNAPVPIMRIGSSRSKIGLRTPRMKSTRISIADKHKVQLPPSALVPPKAPRTKATRISMADKAKNPPSKARAVALTHSVNGVSSKAKMSFKHVKSAPNEDKHDLVKGKPGRRSPESTPENAEDNIVLPVKETVSSSSTSSSSEVKGGGSPRGSISSPLPPLPRQKKSRSCQSLMSMTKSPPPSSGNGNRKTRTSSKSPSNSSSAASSSRPSTTSSTGGTKEIASQRGITTKDNRGASSRMVSKSRPRRGEVLHSEDRNCSSRKLQFRRGRMVDPKLETITAPRRLKFRRARIIGETQHGTSDTARKGSNRTEADAFEVKNSKSEKVLLRHQKSEKAKNVQSLFNNVIKETASKLVQSRKSKVKALVGAFETVISLQDSKPRATITTC